MGSQDDTNGASGINGYVTYQCRDAPIHANRHLRVACIGAGASGLYLAYKLRKDFTDFTLDIYEKSPDIGGTWFENRYPGCACDAPAHNYTYSFEPKWDWSSKYASATEIFQYFSDFATKYDLRRYISFSHEVVGAQWDEDVKEWIVDVREGGPNGHTIRRHADFLINASGVLNKWKWPNIADFDAFKGPKIHSASWDQNVDLKGKRVGLIGNGSSGIQISPQIQKVSEHVTTFIRQPTYVVPQQGMGHQKYTPEEQQGFRDDPESHLKMRKETERAMIAVFPVFVRGSAAQTKITDYMRDAMKDKLAGGSEALDPEFAKLIPDFPFGCRRLTPGVGYLESLTKPNVTVARGGGVARMTPGGCMTSDGREWPLDVLICATGFDTTFRPRFPLIGRGGRSMAEEWSEDNATSKPTTTTGDNGSATSEGDRGRGPRTYLSLAAHGYPNYFMFLGPNCPIGNGPILILIELAGEYMAHFLNRWQKQGPGLASFEPKRQAVDDFMAHKDAFMESRAVWSRCESWYRSRATGRVTALWPGSAPHYMEALAEPRYDDYEVTYHKGANRFAYLGDGFSQTELDPDADTAFYVRNNDREGCGIFRPMQSRYNAKDASPKHLLIQEATERIYDSGPDDWESAWGNSGGNGGNNGDDGNGRDD
ncbi:FAD/NAD(P)-binding domain-containing protein [Apiospora phragmitis]|uniref:FAD/NAD(P)-binding domain-containing protein n=1 Tax=Apiospora phragmitis TaxID=2905665 RepID=A0ABR1VW34_9PEZI